MNLLGLCPFCHENNQANCRHKKGATSFRQKNKFLNGRNDKGPTRQK